MIPVTGVCLNIPLEPDMPSTAIRLDHFLQKSGLVATGGQAKLLIQGEEILVNGAVETRRRRKLLPGDRVQYGPRTVQVTSES